MIASRARRTEGRTLPDRPSRQPPITECQSASPMATLESRRRLTAGSDGGPPNTEARGSLPSTAATIGGCGDCQSSRVAARGRARLRSACIRAVRAVLLVVTHERSPAYPTSKKATLTWLQVKSRSFTIPLYRSCLTSLRWGSASLMPLTRATLSEWHNITRPEALRAAAQARAASGFSAQVAAKRPSQAAVTKGAASSTSRAAASGASVTASATCKPM